MSYTGTCSVYSGQCYSSWCRLVRNRITTDGKIESKVIFFGGGCSKMPNLIIIVFMGNILDDLLLLLRVNSCGIFFLPSTLKLTAPLETYFKKACIEETSSSFKLHFAGAEKCVSGVFGFKLEGMIN